MTVMPTSTNVRALLSELLSRPVIVRPTQVRDPLRADDAAIVAVYLTDEDSLAAAVSVDLPLAAALGGALCLLAPATWRAVRTGVLDEDLVDGVSEVLNVLSSQLNGTGHPHVRRHRVSGGQNASPAADELLATSWQTLDASVTVVGYGTGRLTIAIIPDAV
jgi:hypothetical protein